MSSAAVETDRPGTGANLAVIMAYVVALAAALVTWAVLQDRHPILSVLAADVVATIVVFLFSYAFNNSSFYDPYWSVAPIVIGLCWMLGTVNEHVNSARQLLALSLVSAWGIRLTWNWWRGWHGLGHEDWRYRKLREQTRPFHWLVSFSGIHMFPTLAVFLGCLPLYPALAVSPRPLGWLDAGAALVACAAIWIESTSDRQLHGFRSSAPDPEETLQSGLWARSRHPNYLGEILFWWGVFLFGLAADVMWWWTIVGAIVITVMFRIVSLPLIEKRMLERRPGYAEVQSRIPMLLPRIF